MTKEILCTLGPASMNDCVIARLEDLGIAYFRINLSHTKLDDLENVIRYVQSRTTVPICLDTEGAQIRTGDLIERSIVVRENSVIRIPSHAIKGDSQRFNLYPLNVINELKVGDFLSIDFHSVLVQIIGKDDHGLVLRVLTSGVIGQNKAVTVDRDIKLPALTEKDHGALEIGQKHGIKCVSLSFANCAADVKLIRSIVGDDVTVISKIESRSGVQNLEQIAENSDALLLDRGDLSREIPIEQIPRMQKEIINRTKKMHKKIYVATNLLESMTTSQTPTRAEVNDIYNTLRDGVDGLVLAAETAIGAHPINCVVVASKMIQQYSDDLADDPQFRIKQDNSDSLLLVNPHGGALVDRLKSDLDPNEVASYKPIEVSLTSIMDAEQIAIGTFSPLEGFMNRKDLDSVLRTYRLASGIIWPLPVLLQISNKEAQAIASNDKLALKFNGEAYATMQVEELFTYDLNTLALEMFGTLDDAHPGVRSLRRRGGYFVGGKIQLIKRLPSPHKHFEFTPRQMRMIFENKGWSRVVGFHTRNVIHKVHEYIQMYAFNKYHCDGLLLHPVVGPKKKGDYSADIILRSYQIMLEKYYPQGKALLGAFQSYSRYCGPREAVFTALCRKNFGCSHFIVGRDHTGVGNYYKPDDAQKLFNNIGDIGIVPVFCKEIHYCQKCKQYVEKCEHDQDNVLRISGTQSREMLKKRQILPAWFTREEISEMLLDALNRGEEVFIT